MFDCSRCVHRRGIISENGFHYVCGLSWQSARNCILGKKQHYEELPRYYWMDEGKDDRIIHGGDKNYCHNYGAKMDLED